MIVPDPVSPNGHTHLPVRDLPARLAERYAAGATLDQLAVQFQMPPGGCRRLLLEAGATLRPAAAPRTGYWFDPSVIPLERQREIAEAYRAFPGYEVATEYGIPLPWVQKIARLYGVRKAAPRGYRKRRERPGHEQPPVSGPVRTYAATLVVEAQVEAPSEERAVAYLYQAGTAIRIVRVCPVQRVVASGAAPPRP
jgi:hypothetical protein